MLLAMINNRLVPVQILECSPKTNPEMTGWGDFDGCGGCANCQENTDVEGQSTFSFNSLPEPARGTRAAFI
eukprot:CAMPEP_0173390728 /NCGR_PEP_ID=MMETSP1356-20130122/15952_1 /TAXON_ID=77927 ORGANISM="Hemiselmis virescens, Strain PCC157" /NCGR_SAMPLE_ID=MMETSP1356 /ASSEMBLY_ACC=CAM_ASM_000847 /LENGTH=70 /DNA_ID=CAMNT_0014348187 /DNA_START=22 /DNA_END=234 /DNA_ORIENTATION=-